jgi:hypothetical protein
MYKLIDTNVGISGTSLKGYITADYNDLVACFGEPAYMAERDGFNDKVWTEWQLEFENEEGESFRATIYDWKEEGPFASRENPNYNWHIGGDNFESQYAVSDMLNAYKSNLIDQYADGIIS